MSICSSKSNAGKLGEGSVLVCCHTRKLRGEKNELKFSVPIFFFFLSPMLGIDKKPMEVLTGGERRRRRRGEQKSINKICSPENPRKGGEGQIWFPIAFCHKRKGNGR